MPPTYQESSRLNLIRDEKGKTTERPSSLRLALGIHREIKLLHSKTSLWILSHHFYPVAAFRFRCNRPMNTARIRLDRHPGRRHVQFIGNGIAVRIGGLHEIVVLIAVGRRRRLRD